MPWQVSGVDIIGLAGMIIPLLPNDSNVQTIAYGHHKNSTPLAPVAQNEQHKKHRKRFLVDIVFYLRTGHPNLVIAHPSDSIFRVTVHPE